MEASASRSSGLSLGQVLGAWTLMLVALLGLATGAAVYLIERSANEERAARQLDQSLDLLRHELDAHVRPGRELATWLRDVLVAQVDTTQVLYTLDALGPRMLGHAPIVERVTVLHESGMGWQMQRSDAGIWTRMWEAPLTTNTLAWQEVGLESPGGNAPDSQIEDYRNLGAFRGALSTSRERGDGNRDGRPRLFWHFPEAPGDDTMITTSLSFQSDAGLITALLNVNWSGIHRWTSRIYNQQDLRYMVVDAAGMLLGAPADFRQWLPEEAAPGLPAFEAIRAHALAQGYQFWRTQTTPPENAFVWRSTSSETWLQHFRRYDISPERTLFLGAAFDLSAANLRENALLYWIGVITFGGAGLGLLGSLLLAWRIRRPIEAVLREGRRVDAFEAKRAFWPKTWFAELRELTELFTGIRGQVQQMLREARALQPKEAEAVTKPSRGPIRPPDAFLQAMAATRRELRQAKERVDRDRQVLQELRGEQVARIERLEQQCHALAALVGEARRAGEESFPARLAGVVHRYTGIEGVSIWLAPESGADLQRSAYAGPALSGEQVEALPAPLVQDLMQPLSVDPALTVPNLFSDLRTAPVAKQWTVENFPNLLLTAIPPQDGDWGILCFHRSSAGPWELEWHSFALALAGLLGNSLGTRHFAEHPGLLPLAMEEKHFFREVVESSPGLLIILDESQKIRFLNEAGLGFYGVDRVGRHYGDIVSEAMREAEIKAVAERHRGHDGPPFLSAHRREDGMNVSLWVSMAPLQDEYGDSNGLVIWAMEAQS